MNWYAPARLLEHMFLYQNIIYAFLGYGYNV